MVGEGSILEAKLPASVPRTVSLVCWGLVGEVAGAQPGSNAKDTNTAWEAHARFAVVHRAN